MSRPSVESQLNEDGLSNSETEAAAAKLWTVYVSEAEKYDKSLVESWKSDMEGMLIFAGLFSASLTAFLIESYKTLVPDSGDTTMLLLAQISQQLAASSSGTVFNLVPPAPFTPLASSLACNVLWFISLGLSLTCALVATLLEQWARDFLHKTEVRSAPVIRARVFSYLYYGLKKFGMHRVVEIIPLLLHASLFFFFAGLVAFLIPIHILVMAVAAAILGIVTLVYAILTLLPLYYWDCPYRTPLSGVFWNLGRSLQKVHPSSSQEQGGIAAGTMMDGVFGEATKQSDARNLRDGKALLWTIKSLTDDTELEPLLEAIPDVLWGMDQRRWVYDHHIRRLIADSNLISRLHGFGHNSNSGVLSLEVAKRRQMSYYKAIWALSSLSVPGYAVQIPVLPRDVETESEIYPYYVSAQAVQSRATLHATKDLIDRTSALLATYAHRVTTDQSINIELKALIQSCLDKLRSLNLFSFTGSSSHEILSVEALWSAPGDTRANEIAGWITALPLLGLLHYFAHAARSQTVPYHFEATQAVLEPPETFNLPRCILGDVGRIFELVLIFNLKKLKEEENIIWIFELVLIFNLKKLKEEENIIWLDTIFCKTLAHWEPDTPEEPLPWALLEYITSRKCEGAVSNVLSSVESRAWRQIPETIANGPSAQMRSSAEAWGDPLTLTLTTVWKLCSRYPPFIQTECMNAATWESILVTVSQTRLDFLTPCVVAMVRSAALKYLSSLDLDSLTQTDLALLNQCALLTPLDPADPLVVEIPGEGETRMKTMLRRRHQDEHLIILTEFLQQCCSKELLFEADYTMYSVGGFYPGQWIQPLQQLRFVAVVKDLFVNGDEKLLQGLLALRIWNAYNNRGPSAGPWLNDPGARLLLQQTFKNYSDTLLPHSRLLPEIRLLMSSIELLHTQQSQGDQHGNEVELAMTMTSDEHADLVIMTEA